MSKFLNKIVNGKALEVLKTIPSKTFDLVFADPPYNLQIGKKLKRPDDSKVNGVMVFHVSCDSRCCVLV